MLVNKCRLFQKHHICKIKLFADQLPYKGETCNRRPTSRVVSLYSLFWNMPHNSEFHKGYKCLPACGSCIAFYSTADLDLAILLLPSKTLRKIPHLVLLQNTSRNGFSNLKNSPIICLKRQSTFSKGTPRRNTRQLSSHIASRSSGVVPIPQSEPDTFYLITWPPHEGSTL